MLIFWNIWNLRICVFLMNMRVTNMKKNSGTIYDFNYLKITNYIEFLESIKYRIFEIEQCSKNNDFWKNWKEKELYILYKIILLTLSSIIFYTLKLNLMYVRIFIKNLHSSKNEKIHQEKILSFLYNLFYFGNPSFLIIPCPVTPSSITEHFVHLRILRCIIPNTISKEKS